MRTHITLTAILGVAGLACSGHAPARDAAVVPGAAAPIAPVPTAPAPAAAAPAAAAPGTESGWALFQKKCTTCHGNPAVERAPSLATIRGMSAEKIYAALGPAGIMTAQGATLNDPERRAIAEFMSGRPLGSAHSGAANVMPN